MKRNHLFENWKRTKTNETKIRSNKDTDAVNFDVCSSVRFIHSFARWLVRSSVRPFIRRFVRYLVLSVRPFSRSFVLSLSLARTLATLVRCFYRSFFLSFVRSFVRWLVGSLSYLFRLCTSNKPCREREKRADRLHGTYLSIRLPAVSRCAKEVLLAFMPITGRYGVFLS